MNEKEPIKIRLSTVLIVVLIVIMLIMGYYIYDLSQENNTIAKDLENTKSTKLEPQSEVKEPVRDDDKKTDNEDAFEVYKQNYEKSFKEKINGTNKIEKWLYDYDIPKGIVSAYVDDNGDAYVTIDENSAYSKYGENMKVDENVANIYVCHTGNGSYYDIIFLRKDGTASKIDFEKYVAGTIECNEIPNIEDAVNVISYIATDGEMGADDYYFVDIYGNIIE